MLPLLIGKDAGGYGLRAKVRTLSVSRAKYEAGKIAPMAEERKR